MLHPHLHHSVGLAELGHVADLPEIADEAGATKENGIDRHVHVAGRLLQMVDPEEWAIDEGRVAPWFRNSLTPSGDANVRHGAEQISSLVDKNRT